MLRHAAYCYRWSSVVCACVSVTLCGGVSVGHDREPHQNGRIDQDAVWKVEMECKLVPVVRRKKLYM